MPNIRTPLLSLALLTTACFAATAAPAGAWVETPACTFNPTAEITVNAGTTARLTATCTGGSGGTAALTAAVDEPPAVGSAAVTTEAPGVFAVTYTAPAPDGSDDRHRYTELVLAVSDAAGIAVHGYFEVQVVFPAPSLPPSDESATKPAVVKKPATHKPNGNSVLAACLPRLAGEQCGAGNGRRTSGGGAKVSHRGWPAITGILWKVLDSGDHQKTGGKANDELLGHHGDDKVAGGPGRDVLWGDWDPYANTTRQTDVLDGGAGADFVYTSHGKNTVDAGAGNDHVWAYYGHGTIDCGSGYDVVRIRKTKKTYRVRNCERIGGFSG
jgi:hypothetical protein